MMHRLATTFLVIAALGACRAPEGRERIDFERMRQQQRYDPYERSGFFPDRAVMQAPPAHTVPRMVGPADSLKIVPAGYLTGEANGTDLATIPVPVDSAILSAGAAQYAISCLPCHGAGGFGGGLMAPNLDKHPPALRTPPVSALGPGTMFKVITNGFGIMPPYGWQMPPDARWAVVAYVRSLPSQPMTAAMHEDSTQAAALAKVTPR